MKKKSGQMTAMWVNEWQIMLLCLILCAERKRPWSAGVLGVNGTSRKNASGQWLGCRERNDIMAPSGL
ncbi:MAG: hypothetical protein NTW03_08215 [Verrucomicrobia bacterium]|nr:hypothetical protein [Verrucomicrobiota bacterium]